MLSCAGPIAWPEWRIFALALAVQVPCIVLQHVVGVLIYALSRDRRLAVLIWPTAALVSCVPFWLMPHAVALLSGELQGDAQFGIFVGATAFSFAAFRAVESALGTTPAPATVSLSAWLLYFTSSIDPKYTLVGIKPAVPPSGALTQRARRIPVRMVALGVIASLLSPQPHGASPFGREMLSIGVSDYLVFCLTHVIHSLEVWLFLALCFDIGALPLLAQGVDVGEAFLNPILRSCSPKELWGKRWNLQVNALLRRTAFKPLARFIGPAAAAIATFGVSAIFHEYQFALTFGPAYKVGRVSRFFGSMAGLCLVQTVCERVGALRSAARALPETLQAVLNVSGLAPFAHLFMLIWVDHGMFATVARMVPTMNCASR